MSVTWLHVSDFHIRAGDPYDRHVVLRALVRAVANYRAQGRVPDVIFATGDIANSGKPEEYLFATKFFDDLLTAAGLEKDRLFAIPGNHDVDRYYSAGLARTLNSRELADDYFRLDRSKPHLSLKLGAFRNWYNSYFDKIRVMPDNSTCAVQRLAVRGQSLSILEMNSALFCEGDDDHDKLWVGRQCLDAALEDLKAKGSDWKIALLHHPLEWISSWEMANIRAVLETNIDILLRGHLHEARIETVASVEGEMLHCAAGAAYQTGRWPKRALYGTLDDDGLTIFPIRYEDSPGEVWTTDPSVFPREPTHEKRFPISRKAVRKAGAAPQVTARVDATQLLRFRSNISARGNRPFVGREELIADIGAVFQDSADGESVVILHGPPGVGKSELSCEFARQCRDRYPGGTFFVDASTDAIAIDLARIGKNILDLDFAADLPLNDQGQQTFYAFGDRVLLIYDSVRSFESIQPWLPPAGMSRHVVITTPVESSNPAWACFKVAGLSPEHSIELVRKLVGDDLAQHYGQTIADHAGGLPVQIVPTALSLAYEKRRGHANSGRIALARETTESFQAVYAQLQQPARLLLHAAALLNPQRIPAKELSLHLRTSLGWSETDVERALDAGRDLHLLDGIPDPRMHQLFAAFLLRTLPPVGDPPLLAEIRSTQKQRFVELAIALAANPADTEVATTLMSYPLVAEAWVDAGQPLAIEEGEAIGRALYEIGRFVEARPWFLAAVSRRELQDDAGRIDHERLGSSLHQVGYCLSRTGLYAEARPWFERAVVEAEKGDIHGRIDHNSLGISLNNVGYCLSRTGLYAEARPWFERAVAEAEKGDIHGRIDHESLGSSLHQVGYCLSRTGLYAEARPWFERAVAEAEKGDIHGRIDHASFGISLHQVGYCLSSTGLYAEARPWFERAVAETEKGDIHGRIDHASFGISLHQVGYCLSSTGLYAEARPWFERAVAEAEKGDIHGRIDHNSLGSSLHQVGDCLSRTGLYAEARPWFERAVAEKEKGDIHGRIDHESLAFTLRRTADCARRLGEAEQAAEWELRALQVDSDRNLRVQATQRHSGAGD